MSFEQAAALTVTGITACTALIGKAKLRARQSAFVTDASAAWERVACSSRSAAVRG